MSGANAAYDVIEYPEVGIAKFKLFVWMIVIRHRGISSKMLFDVPVHMKSQDENKFLLIIYIHLSAAQGLHTGKQTKKLLYATLRVVIDHSFS